MKPSAVIFDFGRVIAFPPTDQQFSDAAQLAGLSASDFMEAFWRDRIDYDRGQDARIYWQNIAGRFGRTFDEPLLAELIRLEIEFWSVFDSRLLAWIGDLRRAGLRTGILSNLPRPIGERLRAIPGFLNHFDHITFSYELGVVKPEPDIYHHALQGLGLKPSEALFLDDRPENIEGALAVGLPSYLFTTWEEFVANGVARYSLPEPQSNLSSS